MGAGLFQALGRHLGALALLGGLAVLHTWPLAAHLDAVIPGRGVGDNITSLWSFWWMREALARPELTFFHTEYLFAPTGTPLVLHTHMAPAALAGATLLGQASVAAALNVALILSVFLNGATAYGLAFQLTRQTLPALLAGVLFMLAPPLLLRMMGHFNLVQAWTMVLPVWLVVRAGAKQVIDEAPRTPAAAISPVDPSTDLPRGSGSTWPAIAAGAALALTAWSDYYLFVYALGVVATLYVAERWRISMRRRPAARSAAALVCMVTAVICLAAGLTIFVSGGGRLEVGGIAVSMRSAENPLMAMWLLIAAAIVIRWRLRVGLARRQDAPSLRARSVAVALAVCAVLIGPLIWMGVELVMSGGYTTQQASWRTAPGGIDLATLMTGPPFHPLLGDGVRDLYARLGIDVMESSAWLGLSACVLALLAVRTRPHALTTRLWIAVGAVFFIWALGPFLTVGGANTWLILPQQIARYLPVIGNARMPSRALIVVSLALAVLAALWASRRSGVVSIVAMALACVELTGAPLAVTPLDIPAIYRVLAQQPPGLLLELPVGFRDGFGQTGDFDDGTLLYQTVHGHPMTGGFVARLSPTVRRLQEDDPVIGPLLTLSDRRPDRVAAAADAAEALTAALACDRALPVLKSHGFRYVVIDRPRLSAPLTAILDRWPMTPLAAAGGRELLRLEDACRSNQDQGR